MRFDADFTCTALAAQRLLPTSASQPARSAVAPSASTAPHSFEPAQSAIRSVGKELLVIIAWPLLIAVVAYLAGVEGAILALIASIIVFEVRKADFSTARRRVLITSDPNILYRSMGRLILVAETFLVLGYSVPGSSYQEWMAVVRHPKPRDCDVGAWPFGDKHCHYEPQFTSSQEDGGTQVVIWTRLTN